MPSGLDRGGVDTCLARFYPLAARRTGATFPEQRMAEAGPLITRFDELVELFVADRVLHRVDEARATVTIPTRRGELDGALSIRWQARDGVVQIIQSVPVLAPYERLPALGRAILLLNHGLALPGLGLNWDTGAVYYRLTLPLRPGGGLKAEDLRASFGFAVRTAARLLPALRRVAEEGAPPDGVVADARVDLALDPTMRAP